MNVGDPKQADILAVTGSVNQQNKSVLKNIYDQMSDPKVVVAIGVCACTGGIFRDCYNVVGGIDKVIPVCPARPEQIIDGIQLAIKKLSEKTKV